MGFATQLRQLRALCRQTPPLDMEYVAERLALGVDRPHSGRTAYRGLSRLEPGHRLWRSAGAFGSSRYWEWRAAGGRVHGREEDHVEELRSTFSEAVASRTAGSDPIWADLSGGLDSSSITSVASRLRGRPRLSPVTVVFGESTFSDEREWAAEVQRAVELQRHDIDGDVHHPFSRLAEAVQHWEEPHGAAVFFGVHERYARLMEGSGVPVLLSGIGAEAVVLSKHQEPVHLAELLRRRQLMQLWRELNRWQQALKMPLSSLALRYALGPLMGRAGISYGWTPEGARLDRACLRAQVESPGSRSEPPRPSSSTACTPSTTSPETCSSGTWTGSSTTCCSDGSSRSRPTPRPVGAESRPDGRGAALRPDHPAFPFC